MSCLTSIVSFRATGYCTSNIFISKIINRFAGKQVANHSVSRGNDDTNAGQLICRCVELQLLPEVPSANPVLVDAPVTYCWYNTLSAQWSSCSQFASTITCSARTGICTESYDIWILAHVIPPDTSEHDMDFPVLKFTITAVNDISGQWYLGLLLHHWEIAGREDVVHWWEMQYGHRSQAVAEEVGVMHGDYRCHALTESQRGRTDG